MFSKIRVVVAMCGVFWGGVVAAADLTNGAFKVRDGNVLHVAHSGSDLIDGDAVNYLATLDSAQARVSRTTGGVPVLNVIQEAHDSIQFRKEVALHDDGHLELTVRMKIFPYTSTPDKTSLSYSFTVPAKVLDGTTFKALTGRVYDPKPVEGSFSANRADGAVVRACRFVAFEGKAKSLVFDCDPYGQTALQDYMKHGGPVGVWSIDKRGEHVVFSFGGRARSYGGISTGKILIYQGTYDYEEKHPYSAWHYYYATPAMAQFTFGTAAETEGFVKADRATYSTAQTWGWERADGLDMLQTNSPDIIDNCVFSPDGARNSFALDVTPGYYLATIRVGHGSREMGPFQIALNGESGAAAVRVPAGETKTLILPRYVRRPMTRLHIAFEGPAPWSVRSIVVHPIIYQNEDFTFDRGLWVMEGLFSPTFAAEGTP